MAKKKSFKTQGHNRKPRQDDEGSTNEETRFTMTDVNTGVVIHEETITHDGVDALGGAPETPQEDEPSDAEVESARSDYAGHLKAVEDLAEMTSTPEWQRRHSWMQREIKTAAVALLTEDKPKEIVKMQQRVAAYREFLRVLRQPVDEMTRYIQSMPLFAPEFPKHPFWNEALGRAELRSAPTSKKA